MHLLIARRPPRRRGGGIQVQSTIQTIIAGARIMSHLAPRISEALDILR